jgi:hypothetical protein
MSEPFDNTKKPAPRFGPLVEDTTVVGGVDVRTGQAVIKPKSVDPTKKVDENFKATDPREG